MLHHLRVEAHDVISNLSNLKHKFTHSHTHESHETCSAGTHDTGNRFDSFAPKRDGNAIKWYVDGCSYFWAVSEALERATQSIWILDWWLSPELYLRRPPSRNQEYRLDRMLKAAADRGVKVNVIVYKEVAAALPNSSSHTKHALESLSPNIAVFRHPDHAFAAQAFHSSFASALHISNLKHDHLSRLPHDFIRALYGVKNDNVLYWAHHEKLLLVDGEFAYIGGLDLCFGRWDTHQHMIADVHPEDIDLELQPGQDYNNARIADFKDVADWEQNKLNQLTNSRIGWSDISVGLRGPVVDDLKTHFEQRWNFIYDEKYNVNKDERYQKLSITLQGEFASRPFYRHHGQGLQGVKEELKERYQENLDTLHGAHRKTEPEDQPHVGGVNCQILRSCAKWSHGVPVEHSIANAYIDAIKNAEHFVYIENQFFITATSHHQHPIQNKIGAAIVERIKRAHKNKETFRMIVVVPALPGFAGDLRHADSLSTRAILEFQYKSICRGKHSILGALAHEGINFAQYIAFYNLRNFDRINASKDLTQAQTAAGVTYQEARQEEEDALEAGYDGLGEQTGLRPGPRAESYEAYQSAASDLHSSQSQTDNKYRSGDYDSVAACTMLNGPDLRSIPWPGPAAAEIDAFVSEELYIHTKMLIADDRLVIIGSANLNDRSQLGWHDSEIAVVVEDSTPLPPDAARSYTLTRANAFASSLRRFVMRKHIGLLPVQDWTQPDANSHPLDIAPNAYDWGSDADALVADPLSPGFLTLWGSTATRNTAAFREVFHPVPDDGVRTWKQYDDYYEKYQRDHEHGKDDIKRWGHVVVERFEGPVRAAKADEDGKGWLGLDRRASVTGLEKVGGGVKRVKEILGSIRGSLVDMPLHFLEAEDIAREGLGLNPFTDPVYT